VRVAEVADAAAVDVLLARVGCDRVVSLHGARAVVGLLGHAVTVVVDRGTPTGSRQ
jgi:hypothetical protein